MTTCPRSGEARQAEYCFKRLSAAYNNSSAAIQTSMDLDSALESIAQDAETARRLLHAGLVAQSVQHLERCQQLASTASDQMRALAFNPSTKRKSLALDTPRCSPAQPLPDFDYSSLFVPDMIDYPNVLVQPAPPPPAPASTPEPPFPLQVLPHIDALFLAYLSVVVQDKDLTDPRGEAVHHPLPPRKALKAANLPPCAWRQIKLRIQAFTTAFQDYVVKNLAPHTDFPGSEVTLKRIREFLWTRNLIARFNPSGRKAKSRGSHVWCVETRKVNDSWEFREWKRKIKLHNNQERLTALVGRKFTWKPMIWDPQIYWEDLDITFTFTEPLPSWLTWSPSSKTLHGIPPPSQEDSETPISITAQYVTFGIHHTLNAKIPIDCRPPTDGDQEETLDEDVEEDEDLSDTRIQPFMQPWNQHIPQTPSLSPLNLHYLSPTFVHPHGAFFTPPLTAKNAAFDSDNQLGELASPFIPSRHE